MQTMGPPELDYEKLQDANKRLSEQEGRIDALIDEIDGRDKTIRKLNDQFVEVEKNTDYWADRARELEATCAAMREALERLTRAIFLADDEMRIRGLHSAKLALCSDAGRELLERLAKAEAEQVKPLSWEDYNIWAEQAGLYQGRISHLFACLRDHNHIREAE